MRDWTQDQQVVQAILAFEAARDVWLKVAPPDHILRPEATAEQQAAFLRMRAADWDYVAARDDAIEAAFVDFRLDQAAVAWPYLNTDLIAAA